MNLRCCSEKIKKKKRESSGHMEWSPAEPCRPQAAATVTAARAQAAAGTAECSSPAPTRSGTGKEGSLACFRILSGPTRFCFVSIYLLFFGLVNWKANRAWCCLCKVSVFIWWVKYSFVCSFINIVVVSTLFQ